MVTRDVNLSMRIKRSISMTIFDIDGTTELTAIQLGDFLWNTGKIFPESAAYPPTQTYFINNTDQMDLYVGFTIEGLPENTAVEMYVKRGDQAGWLNLPPGAIYNKPLISKINDPDHPEFWACQMYFQIWVNEPAFGDYTPVLHIHGYETALG